MSSKNCIWVPMEMKSVTVQISLYSSYLSIFHEFKELHLCANGDEICNCTDQSVFQLPFHFSWVQRTAFECQWRWNLLLYRSVCIPVTFPFFMSSKNCICVPMEMKSVTVQISLYSSYPSIFHEFKELHLSANGDEICNCTDGSVFQLPFHFSWVQRTAFECQWRLNLLLYRSVCISFTFPNED